MTTTADPNTLLMGGGGRSVKFEHEGDAVIGIVMRVDSRQRTEMGTGRAMTWPDGNPRMQLVIQLLIDEQEDEDDDGLRNLYVPIPSQIQKAIAEAVRKTGDHGIANGSKLGVKFTRTEKPTQRGFNGQKIYTAKYEKPTVSLDGGEQYEGVELDDEPF